MFKRVSGCSRVPSCNQALPPSGKRRPSDVNKRRRSIGRPAAFFWIGNGQRQPEKLINGAAMACYQMGGCGCVNWFTHYLLRLLASCQRNIGEPPMRHFQAALSPAHCAHWLWRSFWSAVWMRHCSYCRSCCHALLLSSVLASPKLAAFVSGCLGQAGRCRCC